MKSYVEYEVYAYCTSGSDVAVFDTLEEAEKHAIEWSMKEIDVDIIIEKVVRTPHIKAFRNGGEVA